MATVQRVSVQLLLLLTVYGFSKFTTVFCGKFNQEIFEKKKITNPVILLRKAPDAHHVVFLHTILCIPRNTRRFIQLHGNVFLLEDS